MKTIVVGCGRVGSELAYRLYKKGHEVTVIDEVDTAFQKLPADFRGRTLEGDVLVEDLHHRGGFAHAQGLAAVTSSDSLNAVIGHIAQAVYHIPNVVVRNYDPRRRSLCEAFALPVISSTSWGAQRMEELLSAEPLRVVFAAGNGEVEIYELTVAATAQDRSLAELLAGSGALAVALTRDGRAMLPTGETRLVAGDLLHISATVDGATILRQRFQAP
jgi:trk system potassium uptake protein TrkA